MTMKTLKKTKVPFNNSSGDQITLADIVSLAEPIITKWDVESSTYTKITSLFSQTSRDEVSFYFDTVSDLHRSMHLNVASMSTVHHDLMFAQRLMGIAMKRLQTEFYQILCTNRDSLDSTNSHAYSHPSIDDSDGSCSRNELSCSRNESFWSRNESFCRDGTEMENFPDTAIGDLRAIAHCMISCGYTKECLNIYQLDRKSVIDEGIDRLLFRHISLSRIQKLDWESIKSRIETWLVASRIAVKTLFSGERILCDYVFGSSSPYKVEEPCFAEITRDAAVRFLEFPELLASMVMIKKKKKKKKTNNKVLSENMFHFLDLYDTISDLAPDFQTVFSYNSTAAVRLQANSSLEKLSESMRTLLSEFESTVQRDTSKGLVRGGGVHPLTRQTMDFLVLLSEYDTTLANIFVDHRLPPSALSTASPDHFNKGEPAISTRLSWLLQTLQCKINGKAKVYNNVSLLYIFLANNLQYMITKVKESNLYHLLGADWVGRQEKMLTSFLKSYEDSAWGRVTSALAEENVSEFNSAFRDAWQVQTRWVAVEEGSFRDEIIATVKRKVFVPYQDLYRKRTEEEGIEDDAVRYAPEDVLDYMKCIFRGSTVPSDRGSRSSGIELDQDYSTGSGAGSGSGSTSKSGSGSYNSRFRRS